MFYKVLYWLFYEFLILICFSIAIAQPHTGTTGGNSPPLGNRTAIMSGGGAFAKAGGQTEIAGFEYKAQDGEIFGGGGGAAYSNSALSNTSGFNPSDWVVNNTFP